MPDLSPKNSENIRIINVDAIREYVAQSIVTAKEGRKCVDGRYLPDQATGMIARPGGDGGYVMALMAVSKKKNLGLTPEHCFNAVYQAVKDDEGFCMHTDHHADPENAEHKGLIGCGHLAKAANRRFCQDYDVNSDDVEKVINYARNIKEISPDVHMVNLAGEHQELGVIIVNSDDFTVLADNPKLAQMYFVYDQQRDTAFLKKLVKELAIEGVTFEDMKEESDQQLQATLQLLAANLPIYTVTFEEKSPVVAFTGLVTPKPEPAKQSLLKRLKLHKIQQLVHKFSK